MSRIDDFRANLTGGGARPSHFRVELNFPPIAGAEGVISALQAPFMIKAASLPASILQPIEVPFRGRFTKVAGDRVFSNWNIQVLNDNNMHLRNAFETWSSNIAGHANTNGLLAPSSYQIDARVFQLDRNDNIVKAYKFHGVWPQNVSDIGLNFADANSVEEFSVELSVDYWVTESTAMNLATTDS